MMRDVPEGTLVDGRYEIGARIGSGGMADVYCAEDQQLGRKVALKLLHRRFAEDHEFLERFRREASSAAGLQHPNVVGVFDRGEWDGTSYIAMEYLDGRTMKQLITQEGPLDPIRAIDLVVQVLRAARFAHKRGIIHRDLKPHNVIVDPDGRAKVTDFGIARAGASDMTQTGSIMGTAQYLSPEQAQGVPVTPQSDLYSIGILLYEALTGAVPFDGESAVTIALKQVNEEPSPPSTRNPAVSPELDRIVLRLLAKDPAARYADADEVIQALDRCRGHLAAGGGGGGETTAFAPAHAGPSTGELGPPPPIVALPPQLPYGGVEAEEEDEPGRGRWWLAALAVLLVAVAAFFGIRALTTKDQKTVPDVTGQPVAAALARLHNDGFQTRVERINSSAPANRVVREDPQPRSKVDEGSTVTLIVSSGPGTTTVPDVGGQGRLVARRALTKAGFDIEERTQSDDDVPENHVISTTPGGGTLAERGSTVTIVVSKGKKRGDVPSVVGQDIDDARSTLDDAGFKVSTKEQATDDKDPGTVLAQDPAGGTTAADGSTVTLTVAKEPQDVAVPDVTGEQTGDAVNDLGAANLTPKLVTMEVTDPAQDGVVIDQSPGKGKQVKRDSGVTLTVGKLAASTTATTPTTPTTTPTTTPVPGAR